VERTLAGLVERNARQRPEAIAFRGDHEDLSWASYEERSNRLAVHLLGCGLKGGERVAVLLPDGIGVHIAYLACEKAGLIVVGIGPRAGPEEFLHLMEKSGACALLAPPRHRDLELRDLCDRLARRQHPLRVVVPVQEALESRDPLWQEMVAGSERPAARALGSQETFLLNSTSGTTGLPKCVAHHQARWFAFHEPAVRNGDLRRSDIFCSALPSPFGFGLWTAHFTPTILGATCILPADFDAGKILATIERERVTVLAAVSTQFILMLEHPDFDSFNLSSLRLLFTGGEAVPYTRAASFEQRTGAKVLQFYGSNEAGALSGTSIHDTQEKRLRTAGRPLPEMQVRLFDAKGNDTTSDKRGQPGCKGPQCSHGYWNDPAANALLFRQDGWMLTGDIAAIDDDGYLSVVGRTADLIIRGGKNISGPAVEAACMTLASIRLAAAVAIPDPIFGERVCLYAELHAGASLELAELTAHLEQQGTTKECWPELLITDHPLPISSGGKIAKNELRQDAAARVVDT
jgi:acyl-CoA synthetase